ncbi:hypothetical protein K435DRAFT_894102 [Dendrothele bispora CBS 962.96]|uniref:Uncharacterized protein n=1 Tax=Dendrothele bispora (strain CBS 962.96) TaxID=1314807 RepID=A0A4S8M1Q5_DENBC|nr:hypothetical protein K435DRAFT_894102 [Dendrothele bispora CBS 962.96]
MGSYFILVFLVIVITISLDLTLVAAFLVIVVTLWTITLIMMIVSIIAPRALHLEISPVHGIAALHFVALTIAAQWLQVDGGDLTFISELISLAIVYLFLAWNLWNIWTKFSSDRLKSTTNNLAYAQLPCQMEDGRILVICLKKVPGPQFVRVEPDQLMLQDHRDWTLITVLCYQKRIIHVKEEYLKGTFSTKRKSMIYRFRLSSEGFRIVEVYPIRGDQSSNAGPDFVILDAKRTTLKLTLLDSETPREFALTFGRVEEVGDSGGSGSRVWLDILTDIPEEESLRDIYQSYDILKHRSHLRTRALSRSVEPLMENRCVYVAIWRATESANDNTDDDDDNCDIETYWVSVRAVPGNGSQLYRENALSMRSKYVVVVLVRNTEHLLAQEVSPKESWVEDCDMPAFFAGVFFVKASETSTLHLVIFSCKESRKELFTLSLNIHTGMPRVDVNLPPSAAQQAPQFSSPRLTNRHRTDLIDTFTLVFMKLNDRRNYYAEVEFGPTTIPHRYITHHANIRIYKKEEPRNNRVRQSFSSWGSRLTRGIMQNEVTDGGTDTMSERF